MRRGSPPANEYLAKITLWVVISQKRHKIEQILQNVNRKSHRLYRMLPFSMTLIDLYTRYLVFRPISIIESCWIFCRVNNYYSARLRTSNWSTTHAHFIFYVHVSNLTTTINSTCSTSESTKTGHFIMQYWKDLDGPLTLFSRLRHFWSRISQKRCV